MKPWHFTLLATIPTFAISLFFQGGVWNLVLPLQLALNSVLGVLWGILTTWQLYGKTQSFLFLIMKNLFVAGPVFLFYYYIGCAYLLNSSSLLKHLDVSFFGVFMVAVSICHLLFALMFTGLYKRFGE